MLSSQHILVSIFCVAGFIRGAASNSVPVVNYAKRLEFSDCFTVRKTLVPGTPRFYAPIIFARSFGLNVIDRLTLGYPKKIYGVCGFVEGKDESLVQQAAALVLKSLPTWSKDDLQGEPDPKSTRRALCIETSKKYIQLITHGDVELFKYISATQWALFPVENACPRLLKVVGSKVRFADGCQASPRTVFESLENLCCYFDLKTNEEAFQGLAKYAATLPNSHEALYLEFNREACEQFLEQEFSDS